MDILIHSNLDLIKHSSRIRILINCLVSTFFNCRPHSVIVLIISIWCNLCRAMHLICYLRGKIRSRYHLFILFNCSALMVPYLRLFILMALEICVVFADSSFYIAITLSAIFIFLYFFLFETFFYFIQIIIIKTFLIKYFGAVFSRLLKLKLVSDRFI